MTLEMILARHGRKETSPEFECRTPRVHSKSASDQIVPNRILWKHNKHCNAEDSKSSCKRSKTKWMGHVQLIVSTATGKKSPSTNTQPVYGVVTDKSLLVKCTHSLTLPALGYSANDLQRPLPEVPGMLISGSSQNIGQCQRLPPSSSLSLSPHRSTRSGRLDVPPHGACDNGGQQVVVVTVPWRDVGRCQPLATSNSGIRAERAPSRYRPSSSFKSNHHQVCPVKCKPVPTNHYIIAWYTPRQQCAQRLLRDILQHKKICQYLAWRRHLRQAKQQNNDFSFNRHLSPTNPRYQIQQSSSSSAVTRSIEARYDCSVVATNRQLRERFSRGNLNVALIKPSQVSSSNLTERRLNFLCSGAGIGGLFLAITIGKFAGCDIYVDLYEAHDAITAAGARITVARRTAEVMVELGLYNKISRVSASPPSSSYGADGTHSSVRKTFFETIGPDTIDPSKIRRYSDPSWTRTLVYVDGSIFPTEKLSKLDPNNLALKDFMIHIISYPVSQGTRINVTAYASDEQKTDIPFEGHCVSAVSLEEVVEAYKDFEPDAKRLLDYFENPSRWALHVLNELPLFTWDIVALIGAAAHAMTPHFGAGAGQAIEHINRNVVRDRCTIFAHLRQIEAMNEKIIDLWGNWDNEGEGGAVAEWVEAERQLQEGSYSGRSENSALCHGFTRVVAALESASP
ncbi:uncharacterized protein F5147DRAFT_652796 [Suillus discolor]|uniref:FAD-binding domain-containing protein n=1 Tax=Suillus discolor TaxID=1912936 RepID=A0A9P7JU61_9AGAM|nr:uncharacterized protein F5147DRAFT_652796 [Suillus discolor]KAG2108427.1 hypothetical protein F5147DRAFT_652796 [Suillus discolor]